MTITLNGEPRELTDGTTMAQLLEQLALEPRRVAVERNRQLLPRRLYGDTVLADGDSLEIVTLVGGG